MASVVVEGRLKALNIAEGFKITDEVEGGGILKVLGIPIPICDGLGADSPDADGGAKAAGEENNGGLGAAVSSFEAFVAGAEIPNDSVGAGLGAAVSAVAGLSAGFAKKDGMLGAAGVNAAVVDAGETPRLTEGFESLCWLASLILCIALASKSCFSHLE